MTGWDFVLDEKELGFWSYFGRDLLHILEVIIEPSDVPISNYYFPCTKLCCFMSRISCSPDNLIYSFCRWENWRGERSKDSRSYSLETVESWFNLEQDSDTLRELCFSSICKLLRGPSAKIPTTDLLLGKAGESELWNLQPTPPPFLWQADHFLLVYEKQE